MMKKVCLLAALVGCTDHRAPLTGTQSLDVTLVSPTDPGSDQKRLPDTQRTVMVSLQAKDVDGNDDASYAKQVQVYVQFLGTLTPYLGGMPLATIQMTGGKGSATVNLPPVFGPSTLWFDDGSSTDPTYATGVSPTLWYRDPFISDIQRPIDEMAVNALSDSPLENKNITVNTSRYGAKGRMIVTSVFAQGITVADTQCADTNGTPPCVAQDYDYVEVFSFSAAKDQDGHYIEEGQTIDGFAGGISEFNGLTEIGFPQIFATGHDVNVAREPAVVKFDPTWFTNKIEFERNEAGAIEIDNAKVCPLDADYDQYKQWKIDPSGQCGTNKNVINVITSGVIQTDPATLVGQTLPKVVGILRPVNIGTFNVWLIYPRSMADLTLN